jgi:ferritin-like metal-binding protein YciE
MYTQEQRLEPPEMKEADEKALELAENIVSKIDRLHNSVQAFFDELTIAQIQSILFKAENLLEEIQFIADERNIVDDELANAVYMVEEIEAWLNEKEETLNTEGDY